MSTNLDGKRMLITQADTFMGPTLCKVFGALGATVIADNQLPNSPNLPAEIVAAAGHIDVLVINLAVPAPFTKVHDVDDPEWSAVFKALVDPMPRLVRAVLPQMLERRSGKILLMGSAAALRGMKRASTYSAARGAQQALAVPQRSGVDGRQLGCSAEAAAGTMMSPTPLISQK